MGASERDAISDSRKPAYRDRYPCPECGTGCLDCADLARLNLMCCKSCAHPGRFDTDQPYTEEEYDDMWARAGKPRPQR